jgi:succinoglycan biosynthesis transport protein ExoP
MLDPGRHSPPRPNPLASAGGNPAELYATVTAFVRRHFSLFVVSYLILSSIAGAYLYLTPARYTATTSLLLDSHRAQPPQQQAAAVTETLVDSATVASQVQILKSDNIATSVVNSLRLTNDAELTQPRNGLTALVRELLSRGFESSPSVDSEGSEMHRALTQFRQGLSIRYIEQTYVIEISYEALSPEKAVKIANAVADAYIDEQLKTRFESARRASAWLQDRMRELKQQTLIAERAVNDFKVDHNIVSTGEHVARGNTLAGSSGSNLLNEQQLIEINSKLVQARAETAQAKARLDRITEIVKAGLPDEAIDQMLRSPDAAVAETLQNQVITKLRTQYFDIAGHEADFKRRLGPYHLAVVNLDNQMRDIRRQIYEELLRTSETYKSDYEIANTREASIDRSLHESIAQAQTTNRDQLVLRDLQSNAETSRAIYDMFLQRYMETVQQQSFPISDAHIISPAAPPDHQSHPKILLVLFAAASIATLIAVGIGLLFDWTDRGFRTGREVELRLQADCLTVIPRITRREMAAAARLCAARKSSNAPRQIRDGGLLGYVVDAPFSRFAEAIRLIKVANDISARGNVTGFTSTLPEEGKSTIASSYAQLLAHAGRRTILVDFDLRRPSLSRRLAPKATAGLLEVAEGKVEVQDALWSSPTSNLVFLPFFGKARLHHTEEIIGSEGVRNLIERLRTEYDTVVIDLPPLIPIVDARTTTQIIDNYVLIIEWARTRMELVERALATAEGVNDKLLGVALNKANPGVMRRHDRYGSGYYHQLYAPRYGLTDA